MSNQPNAQTEQELGEALMLMICISESTESQYIASWHQSLQRSINSLGATIHELQNAQLPIFSGDTALVPPFTRKQGGATS